MRNLRELRAEKEKLKAEIDEGLNNPFKSLTSKLQGFSNGNQNPMALFDKAEGGRNQLLDEGVKALLTIVASTAVSRFKLGALPKLLITSGVAMITPYVVDKAQGYFKKKN